MTSFGRGVRTRGGRGYNSGTFPRYRRFDNNIFTLLPDPADNQDGDQSDIFITTSADDDDGFTTVRGKQAKRQRVSSSGQSGSADQTVHNAFLDTDDDNMTDYGSLTTDEKLSLILSKVSVNESRVKLIQNRLDSVFTIKSRVSALENTIRSQHDRLKLLEYRSLDIEARSRRKNLLFKGIPEDRNENCFDAVRQFISSKLHIDRDMYLERAHRIGRFSVNRTRPIIVAFRDYCDTEDILNASNFLRDSNYGISKDYPNEIARARQSLWRQYKTTRDANPTKRVTLGYPARITVNNETVADCFPDWYLILQGSRISTNTQNHSGDKDINSYASDKITDPTRNSTRDRTNEIPIINHQSGNTSNVNTLLQEIRTVREHVEQVDSQTVNPELMEQDEQHSPSLLSATAVEPRVALPPTQIVNKNNVTAANLESRGRSPTRKLASVGRPRSNSTASNSRTRGVSQRRATSRSSKAVNVPQQGSYGSNKTAQPVNQNNNKTAENKPPSGESQSNLTHSSQSS